MKYACLDVWGKTDQEIENFLKETEYGLADKYINFCQDEFNYWSEPYFDIAINNLKKHNKTFINVICAYKFLVDHPTENIEVQYWPTYYFSKSYCSLYFNSCLRELKTDHYDYYYISMNSRAHPWRQHLLDLMAKKDILKLGAVSWHNIEYCTGYQFKYFDNRKLLLDEDFHNNNNMFKVPKQYETSFLQIVGETTLDALILSEKTAIPLILGKPFLVSSAPYFHKFLNDLGFVNYDEIFDYSFDSELDQEKRFLKLLDNVDEISKQSTENLKDLYLKIKDKVDYNKNLAKKIAFDIERFPPIIKETYDLFKNNNTILSRAVINLYSSLNMAKNS